MKWEYVSVFAVLGLLSFYFLHSFRITGQIMQPSSKMHLTDNSGNNQSGNVINVKYTNQVDYNNCDEQCQLFVNLFKTWPRNKPKAAIYYLTKRVDKLKLSLRNLDEFFNNKFNYPVIIFHEEDMMHARLQIRSSTKSQLFFQLVKFETPEFSEELDSTEWTCNFSMGYKHMCRFHSKLVYLNPMIKRLDYYLRLDDDLKMDKPIDVDLFVFMQKNGLKYASVRTGTDSAQCTQGLWNATKEYIHKARLKTNFFHSWPEKGSFANHFEISELKMWHSKKYQGFVDFLDRKGGIYFHRWGDAPIHSIAVSMFLPRNSVYTFEDIGYQHKFKD